MLGRFESQIGRFVNTNCEETIFRTNYLWSFLEISNEFQEKEYSSTVKLVNNDHPRDPKIVAVVQKHLYTTNMENRT